MLAVKVLSANEFLPNVFTRSLQNADVPIRLQTGIHALFRVDERYRQFPSFVRLANGMAATKSYSARPIDAMQHQFRDRH
jgi:VanZ family protein